MKIFCGLNFEESRSSSRRFHHAQFAVNGAKQKPGFTENCKSNMMNPERWKQIDELLAAVLDIDDPDKRAVFLDEACAGDEALRKEVETLLDFRQARRQLIGFTSVAGSIRISGRSSASRLSPGESIGPYKILSPARRWWNGGSISCDDPRIGREVASQNTASSLFSGSRSRETFRTRSARRWYVSIIPILSRFMIQDPRTDLLT